MALFVPLEQGIQAEFVYRLDHKLVTNRLWFVVVADNPTTGDLLTVADGLAAWNQANLLPWLSRDIRLVEVRCYDATVPYPDVSVGSFVGVDGGIAEDSYSSNVAVKIEFQTETPPALWMNWNFICGVPLSGILLNTIDSTFRDRVEDAYIALLDVFSLFVYRWEATRAVVNGVPLSTREHFRVDHPRIRRKYSSQRRSRMPV
jgi:hypothetical protein